MDEPWTKDMYNQLEKTGREATSSVEGNAKSAGIEAESILLKGNAAKEILNFAEKQKVDIIVVGSLGKSGVQEFLARKRIRKSLKEFKSPCTCRTRNV